MKISVITATHNCMHTVRDALASVAVQTHEDVEHLVIDGASTDGTTWIVSQNAGARVKLHSEPDSGIYDALNKGLRLASGEVIGFLHADDVFADEAVLANIAARFADSQVAAVYGDLHYVSTDSINRTIRHWRAGNFTPARLRSGWMPPHPTLYVRRAVYEKLGGFDTTYRIAADYDFVLRLFTQPELVAAYVPRVLVKMRVGGASNRSLANLWLKSREDLRALRRHRVGGMGTLAWKNLSKLPQFWARVRGG